MACSDDQPGFSAAPSPADLLTRYLQRQATAQQAGLGFPEELGDVVPYEAGPVQPVDPKQAWEEALAVLGHFAPTAQARSHGAPPEWPALVANQEPVGAVAFAVGNFPQLVRNLHALLQPGSLAQLRPASTVPLTSWTLLDWATKLMQAPLFPEPLLALGVLRLCREFTKAAELIESCRSTVPAEWRGALANEEAALAWQRGQADEAVALWNSQSASTPVLFNRGMASLFCDRAAEARAPLTQAVNQLAENSAWHHLGRLYLGLAEMRD